MGGEGTIVEADFIVGPFGIIEEVDEAVGPLLGYPPHELIGQHGSMLVSQDARPRTAVAIDRMRRGGFAFRVGRLLHRDGCEIEVEVRSRLLPEGRIGLRVRRCACALA
jgi:PAS domain S-box-containing protein